MKSPLCEGKWLEFDEVSSTQDQAIQLLRDPNGPKPGVVLAKRQTAGRGRFDRTWFSQPGDSLTLSLVFHAYADHPRPWLIGMAVAAATAAALHCRLNWPNDLVHERRKLGGILTQLVADPKGRLIPVVGVGINLNITEFPEEIRETATSLALIRPGNYDPGVVAKSLIERIELLPEPDAWSDLSPVWRLFDCTPGKNYRLTDGTVAVGIGIGSEGELICSVQGETQSVLAADALFGADATPKPA